MWRTASRRASCAGRGSWRDYPGFGGRWCVRAVNWARAHEAGAAAPVVLASTNEAVLRIVPLDVLQQHAVDVPDTPGDLS